MARYKLYRLKQNNLPVDIWFTVASQLASEAGYAVHQYEMKLLSIHNDNSDK